LKKKPVEAPKPATTVPSQPAQSQQPAQSGTPVPSQNPQPNQAPAQNAGRQPPPEVEAMVTRIMEMGFQRDEVLRALEAAWGNGERAVELLMTGAPLPPLRQRRNSEGGVAAPTDFPIGEDDDISDEEGINPFEILKNTPQFQQLRALARQSPQMLEQVLHQLPPEIIDIINQNQEEFIRILQEDPAPANPNAGTPGPNNAVPRPQMRPPPGTIQIRVTPEDEAVINNLADMTGCTKDQVIRAYALFEKDAEMTANYLLNHGHDDDVGGGGGFGGFGGGGFGGGDFGGFGQ